MFKMESFESRKMLSVDVAGDPTADFNVTTAAAAITAKVSKTGTLHVKGTPAADRISITESNGTIGVSLKGSALGKITFTKLVKRIAVQGGRGKDNITVDVNAKIKSKLVGGHGKDVLFVRDATARATAKAFSAFTRDLTWGEGGSGEGESGAGATADGFKLMAPISGTTSNGYISLIGEIDSPPGSIPPAAPTAEEMAQRVVLFQAAQRFVEVPTRAEHPQITLGTHPVGTVNDWFSSDLDVFTPDHDIQRIIRVEPDGGATAYDYDADAGTMTVKATTTAGIFFGNSTVPNGSGGFKQVKDTVYLEDFAGKKNWGGTSGQEHEANSQPPGGYVVNALKGAAPDIFTVAKGDGSSERISLPNGYGGTFANADLIGMLVVNPKKVIGDVSQIANGTTLSLAAARAYFDASVHAYLGAYAPTAKQAGHRVVLVEDMAASGKQTQFAYNADGTVTVTHITPSPIRIVDGAETGSGAIVATLITKYVG